MFPNRDDGYYQEMVQFGWHYSVLSSMKKIKNIVTLVLVKVFFEKGKRHDI